MTFLLSQVAWGSCGCWFSCGPLRPCSQGLAPPSQGLAVCPCCPTRPPSLLYFSSAGLAPRWKGPAVEGREEPLPCPRPVTPADSLTLAHEQGGDGGDGHVNSTLLTVVTRSQSSHSSTATMPSLQAGHPPVPATLWHPHPWVTSQHFFLKVTPK